jgi:hypothetical protein
VTDLLSVDLSRGEDRLKLHLALKLADLRPTAATTSATSAPSISHKRRRAGPSPE